MKDLDQQIETWGTDRAHSFKIRGEVFNGNVGLDYEIVTTYMSRLTNIDAHFNERFDALLRAFLGDEEYERFDAWRTACRDEKNPLTIYEVTLIGAAIVEEDTQRPTQASSGSSTGRETSGDGSTGASTSPGTEEDRQASLSAVS
jgi:hypothetical protein